MNRSEYLAFHRETTARLASGTAPADLRFLVYSTQSLSTAPDGRVHRNIVGGFADRLKGVVSAFYLAAATGRYLMIDWLDPLPLETDLSPVPSGLDWRARFEGLPLDADDVQPFHMIDTHFEPYREVIGGGDIEAIWGKWRCPVVNINQMAIDIAKNPRYAADIGSFLEAPVSERELFYQACRLLFIYDPKSAQVRRAYDELATRLSAKPYRLGLQFRTGGDGDWPDPRLDAVENYRLLMAAAEKKLAERGTDAAVFVTTDSARVKRQIIDEYGARLDIVSLDVPPVHYERSGEAAAIGASFMIAENTLLGLCDEVLCGAGGFGIVGAWRGNRPVAHYARGPIG
jgi:hypothetical protein